MASSINFNQFLEKEKLKSNGSNFTDWFRHVRIFLSGGNLQFVLDAPLGDHPAEDESDEVKAVYATRKTRYSQVQCAILCSLESDLQKRFEHHDPHELMNELKAIFETHAAVECYEASKHFFSCMMEEGSSVSEHMLAMTGHAKKLSDLGIVIPNRLGINRVLQSLPPSYKNFVMNYNMQNMNKELPELFGMLKAAEIEIKKEHQVLMVNKTTSFKKQGKSKGKFKKGGKKAATPPMKPKNGPKPDAECYYCKEKGHWKRNCSKYLADLKSGLVKKKKEEMASPINFNQFLEKEKLKSNGSNFTDWFRHVRIFLSGGNLQFVLDAPLGDPPAEDESDEVKAVYATRKTRYSQVQCAILCSLESDLQKRFEHHDPHELMNELKAIFETHAAVECYEASKHFFSCMMEEGSSVSEHMLAMTGHAKKLSDLGIVIPNRLGINRVLQSLPPSYKNFVMNYNMQNMNKELPELFGMLKAAEIEIKKEHQVLMVNKTTSFKKQGKSKGKFKKGGKKAATPPMKPKNGPKLMLSAITARRRDTGSVIAPSIWLI
ncbi:hypothetical protein QYE76_062257 [Lolium multiflorum]|uniref:CCHC-type domain-containing protein n=1 Tax=Lolium multiflorum TaxID=4521 RepID=A0AAD8S2W5_LOLMU|nr:hypothetical protein QYE76_062257 [Lolium multiflorum]